MPFVDQLDPGAKSIFLAEADQIWMDQHPDILNIDFDGLDFLLPDQRRGLVIDNITPGSYWPWWFWPGLLMALAFFWLKR